MNHAARDITLLGGSIGQELVKRSGATPTPLWSTSVMLDRPELLGALHAEYFAVGATVATTNSYPVLPDRLSGTALADRQVALLTVAAEQAVAARDAHGSGRIAGSLGPLGASYRTDFSHTLDEARALYRNVIETLAPHVDVFAAETVSSLAQLRNVIGVLTEATDKPIWIALSVDDGDGTRLRSGEPLAEARALLDRPEISAVMINCSRPEAVRQGLPVLANLGKPFGAYANGFTRITEGFLKDKPTVAALSAREDLDPETYADHAMSWVEMGASLVGGCCEVGPAHIAELARRLRAAGHRIV